MVVNFLLYSSYSYVTRGVGTPHFRFFDKKIHRRSKSIIKIMNTTDRGRNDVEEGKVEHHAGRIWEFERDSSSSEVDVRRRQNKLLRSLIFISMSIRMLWIFLYLIVGNEKSGLFDTTKTEFLVWCSVILGVAVFVSLFCSSLDKSLRRRKMETLVLSYALIDINFKHSWKRNGEREDARSENIRASLVS